MPAPAEGRTGFSSAGCSWSRKLRQDYVHGAGHTARAGESGSVVTLVLAGQRRETSRMMAGAGIEPTVTTVCSGEAELSRITGAKTPSGIPLDGGPAVPRPKNSNAPFRGLGTSKGPPAAPAAGSERRARPASSPRPAGPPSCIATAESRRPGSLATGSTTLGPTRSRPVRLTYEVNAFGRERDTRRNGAG